VTPPTRSRPPDYPHDLPLSADLLAAAQATLRDEILPAVGDAQRFPLRVALNVLAVVERELRAEPATSQDYRRRLRAAGFASEAELSRVLRRDPAAWLDPQLRDLVRGIVAAKLDVAIPLAPSEFTSRRAAADGAP
jgi:hypothetical protein